MMSNERDLQMRLQSALRDRMPRETDRKGYVRLPEENLVDGVCMAQFEEDLREGDGDELRMKFCAVHSSTALAVNCFAWFKTPERRQTLSLLNRTGAKKLHFEYKLPIFKRGTPPNMDVWIDRGDEVLAIESKLTEYFVKKPAKFSTSYDRLKAPEHSEYCWWEVYERAKKWPPAHLDIAQLVKHYFGLWAYRRKDNSERKVCFLYLFWEPENWKDHDVCNRHREECESLREITKVSAIPFIWMIYTDLWRQWLEIPALAGHAKDLIARYCVSLP